MTQVSHHIAADENTEGNMNSADVQGGLPSFCPRFGFGVACAWWGKWATPPPWGLSVISALDVLRRCVVQIYILLTYLPMRQSLADHQSRRPRRQPPYRTSFDCWFISQLCYATGAPTLPLPAPL